MSINLLNQFEFLFGSIGVTLSLFFGIFLLFTYRQQPKANLFLAVYLLAFGLRIGKSLFHNDFEIPATIRTYILASLYLIGPSIWLYSKYLTTNIQKIEYRDWIHFIPFIIFFVISGFIPNDGTSSFFVWFYNGTIFSMFVYTLFTYWKTIIKQSTSNSTALLQKRNWLRFFLIANFILTIIYFLISTWIIPYYPGIAFSFSLVIVLCALRALRFPKLFKTDKAKYGNSTITKSKSEKIAKQLRKLMEEERPYLQSNLSLISLAEKLDVSSKELSQVINQEFQVNYAQYIVAFRLKEAKRLLASVEHEHLSIAAIAYDSGFNSISSFNSQFKKQFKVTAKSFRENNS